MREILIAEDNPADVRLMQEALCTLDPPIHIQVAHDGEEALNLLRHNSRATDRPCPGILFLDFHLPKVDAREILAYAKGDRRLRDMAVVVLTTSATEELIQEAYGLGADCYLSKPSDLDVFLHTIQSAASYWMNLPARCAPGDS